MEPLVLALSPVYSRVIPFELTFSGAQGESYVVWAVESGAFELAAFSIRGTVAMDLNICDTSPAIPIAFVAIELGRYVSPSLGLGRVRSNAYNGSKLILLDPVGVAGRVKGIAYGYEVTREGYYR
jgi:hypothetical protein